MAIETVVLILVLVEHTLGGHYKETSEIDGHVLILVLVEHTLGVAWPPQRNSNRWSLNPCFSGTYSRRERKLLPCATAPRSLNPCFSGTYSRSYMFSP